MSITKVESIVTLGKGTPQRSEGKNGDITIRTSRGGLKMFVKQSNTWHNIDLDINLKEIALSVKKLEEQIKKLTTKRNNFPVVDKLLLKQSGGAAAVGIQNKSGKIAFRNSADSADAELINPKITGTVGDGTNPIISTTESNTIKLGMNTIAEDFEVWIAGSGDVDKDTSLRFLQVGAAKWSMGFNSNSNTTFRIGVTTIDGDGLQLTSAGALTVDSTVTSSNGVCQGTSVATSIVAGDGIDVSSATGDVTVTAETASVTNPGIVELATTAETNTGTDTARAVTPDGLDGWEGSDNITTLGDIDTGSITSGFQSIDTGSGAITTTGLVTSGTSLVAGATLTASLAGDTTALKITQTLNAASGTNAAPVAEHYSALQMNITETDSDGFDKQNFINCEGAGSGTTEKFKVALDGNVTAAGTVTSSNGICGGPGKWIQVWSARAYTKNDTWYHPNSAYGIAFYQWSTATSAIPSTWGDDRNPIIIVPHDCVLNSYYIYGNINSSETIEFALMKGTDMAWDDSNGDLYNMTNVGATQSSDWTALRGNKLGQTGLSVALSEGDNLIPFVRRTTNDTATTRYMEINFSIVATLA